MINILEYLENTVKRVPQKMAYADEHTGMTFREVYDQSRAIGTYLYRRGIYKQPVVVFMGKTPKAITAFYGVVYGGNFYVPIDQEMPRLRIHRILKNLNPKAIICDDDTQRLVETFDFHDLVLLYDEIIGTSIEDGVIHRIRARSIDTDPLYIVFTSGSTGVPKGVVANHRSVMDYIEQLSGILGADEGTIFGNQTPLYFDACLKELYTTLKVGGTTYIIPKSYFMFPIKLVEFLNEYRINTICWVVSALTMISSFRTFETITPKYLHTIAFGSEVFPIKQFNSWRRVLPQATFINLYGPTEATGMCCHFKVERKFEEGEVLPIGQPFKNTEILLLNQHDQVSPKGEMGEICIRGTSLTMGYYNDFERTKEVFVQNPLNNSYPELIYRTGDLGKYNERGELVFVSRKDDQIKHMGHRIELGEIEVHVGMLKGIKSACCVYKQDRDKIILYYVGEPNIGDVARSLKKMLPRYMVPNQMEQLPSMPLTANGKINRAYLKERANTNKREE